MSELKHRRDERGAALLEFTIGALVFLTAMFAVLEFGRLLWTHNALSDAARRGARYAVNHPSSSADAVRNVAIYGDPAPGAGAPRLVNELTPAQVQVEYKNYNLGEGTVSVSIVNYDFRFVVPIIGKTLRLPAYRTTLTGENAGHVPPAL